MKRLAPGHSGGLLSGSDTRTLRLRSTRSREGPATDVLATAGGTLDLDALVAPLRADVVSGAAVVARTAAEVVRRAAVRVPCHTPAEFRRLMGELSVEIMDAQPAMAPLVFLARIVLESVEEAGDSVDEARRIAARTAEEFRSGLERRTQAVGERAAAHLPANGRVLTLSSSSTVKAALLERVGDPGLQVVCLESRPVNEGRMLAEVLGRAGLRVVYAVDAAAGALLEDADLVLLGADSVGDAGVVNKIGSALVAREARRRGVPVVVTADRTKFLPPEFPQPVTDERPPEEVWRAAPGVRVWNRYFEVVGLDDVSVVVTEEEDLSPAATAEVRGGIAVPVELAAWAAARRGDASSPS